LDELKLFEKLDLKFGSAEATPGPEQAKTPYQSVVFCRMKIIELRRPLPIHELHQFVTDDGFVIDTPKPKSTLGARLRDHADELGFIFLPKHGWWLNHLPYPPASYYPNPPQPARVAMPVEGTSEKATQPTDQKGRYAMR
jgi:hypothetical protein